MKVTTEQTTATVRRVVKIEDGPVLHPDGYRRKFQVETVVIDYVWKDGRFQLEGSFSIHMSGHWIKKDGTHALDTAAGMRPSYLTYTSHELEPQYNFLLPLVDQLRPGPDLSMIIMKDHEL